MHRSLYQQCLLRMYVYEQHLQKMELMLRYGALVDRVSTNYFANGAPATVSAAVPPI